MRFQIFFEFKGFVLVGKGTIPEQIPWYEFGSVGGFSGIVSRKPLFQICGRPGIFLIGKINAAENINIPHQRFSPSSPFGLCRALLRPNGFSRRCHAKPVRAKRGGAKRDRTADLLHAMQALSQLSYSPIKVVRLEAGPGILLKACPAEWRLITSGFQR